VHSRPRARHELIRPAVFRPPRLTGVATGLMLTTVTAAAAAAAGTISAQAEPEFRTFLGWVTAGGLASAAALLFSWTFCVMTLSYRIQPGWLTITWGLRRIVMSLDDVESILPGRTVDEVKVSGLNWWGCHIGSADIRRVGFTLVYATTLEPSQLLFLRTTDESYALSITQHAAFADEVESHRLMDAGHRQGGRVTASGLAVLPLWRDRSAMTALLLGAVVAILVVGYVFSQYPGLPPIVEFNFPGVTDVVRIGNKQELLRIAYVALTIFCVNGTAGAVIHARDRAAGLWLLASATLLEVVLLAAAVFALGRA